MKLAVSLLCMLLCSLPCRGTWGAENKIPGRLFFTPQLRAALDREEGKGYPGSETESTDDILTINGEIWHNRTRQTRWINGTAGPGTENGLPTLSVGDTYQRATGKRERLLGEGRIRIPQGSTGK